MNKYIKKAIMPLIIKCGYDLVEYLPTNYDELTFNIFDSVKDYTMTGIERVNAVIEAVKYVEKNKIGGVIVECGVWKGGSTMAMALTLKMLNSETRELYLYDTFSGMNAPTDDDIQYDGTLAEKKFSETKLSKNTSTWCAWSLDKVRENVFSTGYPQEKFHFIKGEVENTIPENIPQEIALLRLDTDWYESTKHELIHLFPLLSPNGVIIIDDYGHWGGAKKAVDEYISENNLTLLLNRIDYTGRVGIKSP